MAPKNVGLPSIRDSVNKIFEWIHVLKIRKLSIRLSVQCLPRIQKTQPSRKLKNWRGGGSFPWPQTFLRAAGEISDCCKMRIWVVNGSVHTDTDADWQGYMRWRRVISNSSSSSRRSLAGCRSAATGECKLQLNQREKKNRVSSPVIETWIYRVGQKNGATLFCRNTVQICTIFFAEIKVV